MKLKIFILITGFVITPLLINGCKDNSTNPTNSSNHMVLIGSYNTSGYAEGIYVQTIANIVYAFVADGPSGMQVINVTNRSNPILVSHYQTTGSALDITLAPINSVNYAFISDGNQGLDIVNLSNPGTPVLDTTLLIPNDRVLTAFVDVSNKILYVGTYYGSVYIYNLAGLPSALTPLSTYTTVGSILSIQVSNSIAFLAEASVGLELVNVVNPIYPSYIKSFHTPSPVYDVRVSSNYVYLADYVDGVIIIDVTNPFMPNYVGSFKTSGASYVGLSYNASLLYTADADFGVETVSVATPSAPLVLGNYKTGDIAQRLFYYNGYIYVAASSQGLLILQYTTQ